MPIVQVPYGSANLLAQSDYQRINNLLATNFMNVNKAIWEDAANNIVQGAVFHVGGTVYYANAATAIGGVASDYIKLTPGGVTPNMTLTPSYVANLAGVTWNSAYNGYYDVSGNAYIFDELVALEDGEIAACNTRLWRAIQVLVQGDFTFSGDPTFSGNPDFTGNPAFTGNPTWITANSIQYKVYIIEIGDWNMESSVAGSTTVVFAHGLPDHRKIRGGHISIRNDDGTIAIFHPANATANNAINGFATAANIILQCGTGYDGASYNSTSYNRGWVTIIYEV